MNVKRWTMRKVRDPVIDSAHIDQNTEYELRTILRNAENVLDIYVWSGLTEAIYND